MNELKIFENPEFGKIRTMEINGEPYFVGREVAMVLGYKNPLDALTKHVEEEDKGVANCDTLGDIASIEKVYTACMNRGARRFVQSTAQKI